MALRNVAAAGLLLVAAACQKDEEHDTRETLRSWRSTIELVQLQRERHNVPASYAKQVARQAADDIAKELKKPHSRSTREEATRIIALAGRLAEEQR